MSDGRPDDLDGLSSDGDEEPISLPLSQGDDAQINEDRDMIVRAGNDISADAEDDLAGFLDDDSDDMDREAAFPAPPLVQPTQHPSSAQMITPEMFKAMQAANPSLVPETSSQTNGHASVAADLDDEDLDAMFDDSDDDNEVPAPAPATNQEPNVSVDAPADSRKPYVTSTPAFVLHCLRRMATDPDTIGVSTIIDVREGAAFSQGHIPHSHNYLQLPPNSNVAEVTSHFNRQMTSVCTSLRDGCLVILVDEDGSDTGSAANTAAAIAAKTEGQFRPSQLVVVRDGWPGFAKAYPFLACTKYPTCVPPITKCKYPVEVIDSALYLGGVDETKSLNLLLHHLKIHCVVNCSSKSVSNSDAFRTLRLSVSDSMGTKQIVAETERVLNIIQTTIHDQSKRVLIVDAEDGRGLASCLAVACLMKTRGFDDAVRHVEQRAGTIEQSVFFSTLRRLYGSPTSEESKAVDSSEGSESDSDGGSSPVAPKPSETTDDASSSPPTAESSEQVTELKQQVNQLLKVLNKVSEEQLTAEDKLNEDVDHLKELCERKDQEIESLWETIRELADKKTQQDLVDSHRDLDADRKKLHDTFGMQISGSSGQADAQKFAEEKAKLVQEYDMRIQAQMQEVQKRATKIESLSVEVDNMRREISRKAMDITRLHSDLQAKDNHIRGLTGERSTLLNDVHEAESVRASLRSVTKSKQLTERQLRAAQDKYLGSLAEIKRVTEGQHAVQKEKLDTLKDAISKLVRRKQQVQGADKKDSLSAFSDDQTEPVLAAVPPRASPVEDKLRELFGIMKEIKDRSEDMHSDRPARSRERSPYASPSRSRHASPSRSPRHIDQDEDKHVRPPKSVLNDAPFMCLLVMVSAVLVLAAASVLTMGQVNESDLY